MLSPQEMSDRFEIQDLVYHYSHCIDQRNFDALVDVFSEDAHIDYSVFGGAVGNPTDIIAFLKQALAAFKTYQHLNANVQIQLDGDTATGRVMCFNPQDLKLGKGQSQLFMLGLWYRDKYIRTPKGWRIQERVEEKSWAFNLPDFINFEQPPT